MRRPDDHRHQSPPGNQRQRSLRPSWITLALLIAALALTSCNGLSSETGPAPPTATPATPGPSAGQAGNRQVHVDRAYIASLNADILVDGAGHPLYVFAPDNHARVTCTGTCTGVWPPLKIPAGATPLPGPGVSTKLLGTDPDPDGGKVATYNHWPLYTYQTDIELGPYSHTAAGQGLKLNGGYWYVIRPSGAPIIQHITHPTARDLYWAEGHSETPPTMSSQPDHHHQKYRRRAVRRHRAEPVTWWRRADLPALVAADHQGSSGAASPGDGSGLPATTPPADRPLP
jgi:predicted lipoprotein with Yx(FWY)xxD motif